MRVRRSAVGMPLVRLDIRRAVYYRVIENGLNGKFKGGMRADFPMGTIELI